MTTDWAIENRIAGAVMIVAAVGTMVAMGHHPAGPHGGPLVGIVHGAMIVLLMALTWGFLMFAVERGPGRPLILAGMLAYAVSLFAHVGAATINGFIVPALADPAHPPVSHDLFRMAWYSNQALAQLGVYMTGAAYVLWSIDLLRDRTLATRMTALAGLIGGIVPVALLASGALSMNVAGASLVYGAHAAWAALVGAMLWGGARFVRRTLFRRSAAAAGRKIGKRTVDKTRG